MSEKTAVFDGLQCPIPISDYPHVTLGHGGGGRLSQMLIERMFLPAFRNPALEQLHDGAVLDVQGVRLALSTDTFVVSPLFFPGGDIGSLAVHGTVNDLAMCGAQPIALTAGFVLEEGLPMDELWRITQSMQAAARAAGVPVVTGDTKVVDRGKADGMFVNTTGVGVLHDGFRPRPDAARPGDVVIVSGPVGRHGMAVMAVREGFAFESDIVSDTANLAPMVASLREGVGAQVHALRDATRGGVASALNEIAAASRVGVELDDGAVPVPPAVQAACEILGLDPLYVANEGVLVAFVAPDAASRALALMRGHGVGTGAAVVGRVVVEHPGMVVLRTGLGGTRVVDLLPGDQLPRIC
jgi:hydrogenase expression/formation protein HypE